MDWETLTAELSTWIVVPGWGGGLVMLALAALFTYDFFQTEHTVRRNFPVVGRLRYFFEDLGHYFRQYFFAGECDERPFDRATRVSCAGTTRASCRTLVAACPLMICSRIRATILALCALEHDVSGYVARRSLDRYGLKSALFPPFSRETHSGIRHAQ